MKPRTWVSVLVLILPSIVLADLPSCYRARCSHCAIQFIAQMCPTTCGNCPQTFGRTYNGNPKTAVHGQPTASVYQIPGQVHSLGQTDGQTQSAYGPQQTAQHGIYQAPSPQQQQVDNQTPHIQQPNNNIPQTYGPPPTAQQYNQQFSQTAQLPSSPQFPQMQPFGGFPSQMNGASFPGFAQPQTPNSAQSGLFNPFQPFLHNSFQAQQPAQQIGAQQPGTYNPFTFPTFAPFTHAPMTLPTGPATFPTFAPFPTPAPATQAPLPQPTYQIPQQPEQTNYNTQQRIVQPQIQTENYAQNGQNGELQRPRQVYNPQQQQQIPAQNAGYSAQQYVNPAPQPASYLQPARANAIATVSVDQQARSIDSTPVQLEKQAFIGAGARVAAAQCPKQPNWEPCITKELANERFRNCCQRLGEGCSQLCNYDQSLTTLQLSVLTGRCPIAKVADMMVCASGYEDATPCCTAYGVFEPGFEHCRPYCNPAAGLPNDGMLAEKYKCLGKLSQIQRCFYVSQRP